jgi:ElaA protein
MPPVAWQYAPWSELGRDALYALLRLRARVFVVEQACPYADPDGLDPLASHLWTEAAGDALACLRVFGPGVRYPEASLGRIVTAPEVRRTGLGRELVCEGLRRVAQAFGAVPVRIGAQAYLERFYGDLGFVRVSDDYLEDNIPHLDMVRAGDPAGRTDR